jgi:hypothetical protein
MIIMHAAILAVAFAMLPSSAPAFADYVFIVPVRIENMTHITTASVSCSIIHDAPGLANPIHLGTPGTGTEFITVRGGNFTGNVTVTVAVSADRLARYTPTSWSCAVAYRWRNPDGSTFSESLRPGEREGVYTRSTGQAIDSATTTVTGPMPSG